jgi:hypothetical protein
MTCSRNLSKHLKNCDQSKTNKKMSQHDFYFFANLMIFFSKKKSNILISFYFFTFVQIFKQNKKISHHMHIWIFSITSSHFERITWIFVYDECHNHFLKKVVSYLILWFMDWWQSHLRLGAHLRKWQRKQNVKRWMWIFFQPN